MTFCGSMCKQTTADESSPVQQSQQLLTYTVLWSHHFLIWPFPSLVNIIHRQELCTKCTPFEKKCVHLVRPEACWVRLSRFESPYNSFPPTMMNDIEGEEMTGEQLCLSLPLWFHQSIHPSTLTDIRISHAGALSVTFPDVLTPFQMLK